MNRTVALLLALLVVGTCAIPPKGGDVNADIVSAQPPIEPALMDC